MVEQTHGEDEHLIQLDGKLIFAYIVINLCSKVGVSFSNLMKFEITKAEVIFGSCQFKKKK